MFTLSSIRLHNGLCGILFPLSAALLLFLSLHLIQPAASASPAVHVSGDDDPLEAGLRALRDGDAPLAVTLLRASAGVDGALSPEALVGLGVAYLKMDRVESSLDAFTRSEQRLSEPLLGWVRYIHARVLFDAGRDADADSMLVLIADESSDSPLHKGVLEQRLALAVKGGDLQRERELRHVLIELGGRNAVLHAERIAQLVGEEDPAESVRLRSMALELPGTDEARGRSAQQLLNSAGELDPEEILAAGRVLFELADWNGAEQTFRLALQKIDDPIVREEALYRLGLSLYRRRAYGEAGRILSEAEEIAGRYQASAAYYGACAAAASRGRQGSADVLVSFADRYPESRWAPRALKQAGDRLAESDYPAAREIYSRLIIDYPTNWENAAILFELGDSARNSGDLEDARKWYAQLGGGVFHPHEKAQGWYWAARMASALGDTSASTIYYTRASERYPDTYYGARATQELGISLPEPLSADEEYSRGELKVPEWADASLSAGIVLLRMGLKEEGELQLLYAVEDRALLKERLYSLWMMCMEGRAFGAARRLGDRLLKSRNWNEEDPRFLSLNYPLYFADLVVIESRRNGLDPYLVLALIKQESAFEPEARSYVGARGLMQLMPETAEEWTRRLRRSPVEAEDLYDPEVNLGLGIPYLARLIERFDGSIEKALAAYNGGPTNVRRWERGLPDEKPETFLESIGFSETRTFVRTILNNYYRYRYIWSQGAGD